MEAVVQTSFFPTDFIESHSILQVMFGGSKDELDRTFREFIDGTPAKLVAF